MKCDFFKVESMKKQNGGQTTAALSMANTVNKAVMREPQPFMSLGVDPSHNNNSSSDTTTSAININNNNNNNSNHNHKSSSSSSSSGIKIKTSSKSKSKFANELENILSKELETRRDRETKMQQYTPR